MGEKEEDDDEHYPFPLVLRRDRSSSVASGVSTPSGGLRLTEKDLTRADEALGKYGGSNGHNQ
jgi:hypothetical protein